MRKMTWLRWGLASVIVAGAAGGALIAGCSDDDPPVTPRDSGADTSTDTGTDAPGPVDSGKNGRAILVHASPDLPGFRVCVAIGPLTDGGNKVSGVKPLPDEVPTGVPLPFPMIPVGTGGPLPDLVDLAKVSVTPYLVRADLPIVAGTTKDAGSLNCTNLVGDGADAGLVQGQHWWRLPDIPPGTIAKDHTYIMAIEGCVQPNETDAAATPQGQPGKGDNHLAACESDGGVAGSNLRIVIYDVDKIVADPAKFGSQIAHASPGVAAAFGRITTGVPGSTTAFGFSDAGGGATAAATGVAPFTIKPSPAASLAPIDFAGSSAFFAVVNDAGLPVVALPLPDGGAAPAFLPTPLPTAAALGGGLAAYKAGANFVFVFVGDLGAPTTYATLSDGGGQQPNPYFPHMIAFPTQLP